MVDYIMGLLELDYMKFGEDIAKRYYKAYMTLPYVFKFKKGIDEAIRKHEKLNFILDDEK